MRRLLSKRNIIIAGIVLALISIAAGIFLVKNEDKPDRNITIHDSEIPMGSGKSILAKDAGMISDDKDKAAENADLLIKALNEHNSIIIDGSYYITRPKESLVTQTVEIIGTENSELIIDNNTDSKLFNTEDIDSLTIRDVKFENKSDSDLVIAYRNTNSKMKSIYVERCTFIGNISLYRQYGDTSVNPGIADYGIDEFVFTNNNVYNTELSFIVLFDTPIKYCEISNNNIHNFMHTFVKIEITNDTPFEKDLYNYIKYIKVDSNFVICDDDWWEDTSEANYYAFILFEGAEALYNNNHVEGMKARKDIALYDAYLNARVVNYTNNTWKNNICFDPAKTNNTLLKSKGGGSDSLVRNYSNNTFIVEEGYAERTGQSKDNLFVYFMSLQKHADSYTISNNTFDMYDLRFPESSILISNLYFNKNIIKSQKASGNLAIVKLNDEYPTNTLDVNGNEIEISNISDNPVNLIKVVDDRKRNSGVIDKISVCNNKIAAKFGYMLYGAISDKLVFLDNSITDMGDSFSGFAYNGIFVNTEISGNVIESINSASFYEGRQFYGAGEKNEVLTITRRNSSHTHDGMQLDVHYNSSIPTKYTRSYQVSTKEGESGFNYAFTISYNKSSGHAEVTFENNQGKSVTYRLSSDNDISDGNGQIIKVINENGEKSSPYIVKFFNANGKAGFYISNYRNELAELKVKTVS